MYINPTALRKAKIVYNFGLSECTRVKVGKIMFNFYIPVCIFLQVGELQLRGSI